MQIIIKANGMASCIYSEQIDLTNIGPLSIRRGSHVEPSADGHWIADLSPVNGPQLGPFKTRSQALAAETQWLEQHWLTKIA